MLEKFLDNLQKKPYDTKVQILWSTTAVIAIVLIIIWVISLKSTIKNNTTDTAAPAKSQTTIVSEFLNIERVEKSGSTMKLYFNLNNNTDDILNVPSVEDITLQVSAGNLHPTSILDRQGQAFVQKVLSHTQAFGILTFSATTETAAQLVFDNMMLEKNPGQTLKQTVTLDLVKLNQPANVRN